MARCSGGGISSHFACLHVGANCGTVCPRASSELLNTRPSTRLHPCRVPCCFFFWTARAMRNSRYQTVPTHPKHVDDSRGSPDEGPEKCYDRVCSSFPLVTFFAFLFAAVVIALTLSLSLSKTSGVFIENSIYSATCGENMCLFGFSEYPRDIPCTEDEHCSTYVDPCTSNPCAGEGTDKCVPGSKGDYACVCKDTYNGRKCEKKLNRCDYDKPCFGESTCMKHPTEKERFSCGCKLGWMGTECEYRSQTGDTCASHQHCSGNGECLKRGSLQTCHCSLGITVCTA